MATRCFTCGHAVKDSFEHVDINCSADMTPAEIATLLTKAEFISVNEEKRAQYDASRITWRKLNPPLIVEGRAA